MGISTRRWFLVWGVASLFGCCLPSHVSVAVPVTASMSDSGGEVLLLAGQLLTVRLPSNPSTGYSWTYAAVGDDVLRLDSVSNVGATPNGMVGAPSDMVWSFRAQGTGRAELRYIYARPWEKHVGPVQTFTLRVVVNPTQ